MPTKVLQAAIRCPIFAMKPIPADLKNQLASIHLRHILWIALFVRLLAVAFAKGYGFNDDHFEVVELAQKWLDGVSFMESGESVYLFSLLYPGAHYLLFGCCEALGIYDPQAKMLLARLCHAVFSMLGVYYGYLLAYRLSNRNDTAKIVGLLMAAFWVFSFMAVRNLREFVCVPLLLMGCYYASALRPTLKAVLVSAFCFALAFDVRLQTVFVPLGIGICWLWSASYRGKAFVFGIGFGVSVALTQGLFDYLYYGNPLASTLAYMSYNATNYEGYPNGPWHQYIGTVAGLLLGFPFVPLLIGYGYTAKMSFQTRSIFWASLLLFAFHSYFPNKQERFILPFVPFILLLGVIGFQAIYEQHRNHLWLRRGTRFVLVWLLLLNTFALALLTFTYSKRARVEAMNYLHQKTDVQNLIMEGDGTAPPPPLFYLGKFLSYYELNMERSVADLQKEIASGQKTAPNYLIMAGSDRFEERLNRLKKAFPAMRHETDIAPGFVDNIAFWLNPKHNQNEVWRIYRLQ